MAELDEISQLLRKSLIPNERKEAENTLIAAEGKPGFSILLLHVVATDSYDTTLRLAGALYFKNFIKRNWTVCLIVNVFAVGETNKVKDFRWRI
jgi:exportin-2 (importin alpha re-exporter)